MSKTKQYSLVSMGYETRNKPEKKIELKSNQSYNDEVVVIRPENLVTIEADFIRSLESKLNELIDAVNKLQEKK